MKKLIALLLSFLLLFSFCGCSDANLEPEGWYSETGINLTQKQLNGVINQDFETPKNVIVIIGDGMGPNDIEIAHKHSADAYSFGLVLNKMREYGEFLTVKIENMSLGHSESEKSQPKNKKKN